jgi:hypothetical protein
VLSLKGLNKFYVYLSTQQNKNYELIEVIDFSEANMLCCTRVLYNEPFLINFRKYTFLNASYEGGSYLTQNLHCFSSISFAKCLLFTCNNLRSAEWIFTKFDVGSINKICWLKSDNNNNAHYT